MLDVLHYFYEDDLAPRWEQDGDVKSRMREVIYETMYKKRYKYSIDSKRRTASFDTDRPAPPPEAAPLQDPRSMPVKPFIPATDPEDLIAILGPPLR